MRFNYFMKGLVMSACAGTAALAATVPFIEDFAQTSAGWRNGAGTMDLQWVAAGGPDGGSFASGTVNFLNVAPNGNPLVGRAQEEWGSSDHAFVGDYIAQQVQQFRVFVRHDAPVPLDFFVRFSGPANFPGAVAVWFAPVQPNAWTEVVVPIDAQNPQFVTFEGSNFDAVFSNVGHVQIGLFQPAAVAGMDQTHAFDIDKATLLGGVFEPVPLITPAGLVAMLVLMSAALAWRFRRPRLAR